MKKRSIGKLIHEAPSDIQAIAGMISEAGKALIEEDELNPANVLTMVNFQLTRLVDSSIIKCVNPGCSHTFTLEEHLGDPLKVACGDACKIAAVKAVTKEAVTLLSSEIPQLQAKMKASIKEVSSSAVRKGDEADRASVNIGEASERIAAQKIVRLGRLKDVLTAIEAGIFPLNCANKRCGEEIPVSARLQSPEIGYCMGCQTERRHRGR